MFKRIALAATVFVTFGFAATGAFAQSAEDEQACTPDAQTLCQEAIPDHDKVRACLIKNKRSLSPACRAVFDRGAPAGRRHRHRTH